MSRYLPNDVFELDPAPRVEKQDERRRAAWLLDLRSWLFLGMGLGGILTVALIVTADQSAAGIDGMRAVRAFVPQADAPEIARIPFLGGIITAIHDLPPAFFAPSPDAVGQPAEPSARPQNAPSSLAQPTASAAPAAGSTRPPSNSSAPGGGPNPTATHSPSATPAPGPIAPAGPSATPAGPTATPGPSATPTPAPTVTPTSTPTPNVAITTDRGASAIVSLAGLVPGDAMIRTVTVQNTGSLAFKYTVSATQTASTLLWTDAIDGLQVTVSTSGGTVVYAGPLSGLGYLAGPTTLAPGTSELLRYAFAFPANASNAFQGLTQDLTLVFDAVQFP